LMSQIATSSLSDNQMKDVFHKVKRKKIRLPQRKPDI